MAKGRTPSAEITLASLVKNYRRLQRSLLAQRGQTPELAALLQRQQDVRRELRQVRERMKAAKKQPRRQEIPEDPTLASLRDSILLMSRNLGIAVNLH